jgi:hypothetical protein
MVVPGGVVMWFWSRFPTWGPGEDYSSAPPTYGPCASACIACDRRRDLLAAYLLPFLSEAP